MGRIGADASHHQQGIAFEEGDPPPPPPPPLEEDFCEPPADYQPPTETSKPPQVHSFPPPEDVKPQAFPPPQQQTPQPFPPNQNYMNNLPQQNHHQNIQPQQMQINNNNVNIHQGIPMAFAPSPLPAHQNLLQNQPWKTHLFDCMKDPQNAVITLFFPCVTFGQIAEVVDNGSTSCATSGILYSLIAFFIGMPCLMSCGYRSKLRAKFGLVESPAPDCLLHCFCECCALCQEYRELNARGFDPSIGHAGNVAKQQHQRLQQFGMTPPMHQRMV